MCNGYFASKLAENAVILHYNFSLSDCHFSLIFMEGELTSPYCQGSNPDPKHVLKLMGEITMTILHSEFLLNSTDDNITQKSPDHV